MYDLTKTAKCERIIRLFSFITLNKNFCVCARCFDYNEVRDSTCSSELLLFNQKDKRAYKNNRETSLNELHWPKLDKFKRHIK